MYIEFDLIEFWKFNMNFKRVNPRSGTRRR